MTLVCFAVKEEAGPFKTICGKNSSVTILITGIGHDNAQRAIRNAIESRKPDLVFSCGFAGGLNPDLKSGDLVFNTTDPALIASLQNTGARPAQFLCCDRIAVTVADKAKLRFETGADIVEMESEVIAAVCREKNIPCSVVRIVLDTAGEDLPLDFNSLMNERKEIDFARLGLALMKSPGKIPSLIQLQRQGSAAAGKLAQALKQIIPP